MATSQWLAKGRYKVHAARYQLARQTIVTYMLHYYEQAHLSNHQLPSVLQDSVHGCSVGLFFAGLGAGFVYAAEQSSGK